MWWRNLVLLWVGALVLVACAPSMPEATASAPTLSIGGDGECLQAAIRALEMERTEYAGWLQSAPGSEAEVYRRALDYLDAKLAKYRSLSPAEFRIASLWHYIPGVHKGTYGRSALGEPKPIVLSEAWVDHSPPALVNYKGMSRSGPFYTVVGVRGSDLSTLKPGVHYRLVLQPLMPKTYPFPSFYVCVVKMEPVGR